jgi:hypothetical protein
MVGWAGRRLVQVACRRAKEKSTKALSMGAQTAALFAQWCYGHAEWWTPVILSAAAVFIFIRAATVAESQTTEYVPKRKPRGRSWMRVLAILICSLC